MNEQTDNVSAQSAESKGIAGVLGNPEGFVRRICTGSQLGARTLVGAVKAGTMDTPFGLSAWFMVFLVVALQTVTLVRPMLAPVGTPRDPAGKCFFLTHFFQSLSEGGAR